MRTYFLAVLLGMLLVAQDVGAQGVLHVYGPGGPAPAMKEAAAAFGEKSGVTVDVTAGPTSQWLERAKNDGDVIYSGSEAMMSDFVAALEGRLSDLDVYPLYIRPMAILVRPGNPKRIEGFKDLLDPDVKILVVHGAGQVGAWEDIAGRKGDIKTVRKLRANIVGYAKNSGEARQQWIDQPDIDAWLIFNIWQVANPTLADLVEIESEYAIYRDTAVAPTTLGKTKPTALQFIEYLKSPEGKRIFKKWGWSE